MLFTVCWCLTLDLLLHIFVLILFELTHRFEKRNKFNFSTALCYAIRQLSTITPIHTLVKSIISAVVLLSDGLFSCFKD